MTERQTDIYNILIFAFDVQKYLPCLIEINNFDYFNSLTRLDTKSSISTRKTKKKTQYKPGLVVTPSIHNKHSLCQTTGPPWPLLLSKKTEKVGLLR